MMKSIDDCVNTLLLEEKLLMALEKTAVATENIVQTQLINIKILQMGKEF